ARGGTPDSGLSPCPGVWGHGLGPSTPPRADLRCSVTGLLYMLWSWTPVVPTSRLVLPSRGQFPGLVHTCSATTELGDCRGSTSFTLVALRPAQSLSTLRPPPRGDRRKTRYCEGARRSQRLAAPSGALFPQAG